MTLEKAKLKAIDNDVEDIEFMFNPNELSFGRSMELEQAKGAHTGTGENKTSFKYPKPYSLSIKNIIFDTYETGENVLTYVEKFTKSVEFTQKGEGEKKRPPIYLFTWGNNQYLRCFVKSLNFKLSLFLSDGTPVRASIDLSLEQVELATPSRGQSPANPTAGQRQSAPSIFLS
ncbi:MAG: hypothetical protein F6J95_026920 [Leptolyngbya sp. SIO1E4]|nr:hypothetical protein [Leptolyngbya sp. SIO1E4]